MIKFDTINGQLCLMLEKPIPLTPKTKFPCAVRLIQDSSPMGRYNNRLSDQCLLPFICVGIDNKGDMERMENAPRFGHECYEILGYPVQPNSTEWALYRMLRGNMVCQKDSDFKRYYKNGNVRWHDRAGIERSLTTELFLKNFANTIDWQIYAEKPLLAESRKGDLCQRRDGKWVQIDSLSSDRPCPIMCRSDIGWMHFFTLDGRNHNAVGDEKDIIHTEPLAAKGSAEWAWQMAKLGIETKCSRGKIRISKSGMIEVCYNGMAYAMPMTQSPENRQYIINKMCECSPDGWQLYEPKPEPGPEIVAHKQHANCLVCGKEIEGLLDGHATVSIKRYSISSLYESTYSHYCGKCFLELGFDATERELRNRQQPIAEPEPKPEHCTKSINPITESGMALSTLINGLSEIKKSFGDSNIHFIDSIPNDDNSVTPTTSKNGEFGVIVHINKQQPAPLAVQVGELIEKQQGDAK